MAENPLTRAKVLIVDDEPSNVRLLERILELNGRPKVRSTTDSRQTIAHLLEFEPDLVLLDLHMPHLDGFTVMEQIKMSVPAESYLPVLILTADITAETKKRAFVAGAKDFITKPLDQAEVILRIRNLLENRFLHHELQEQNIHLEQQVRVRTAQLEKTLHQLRSTQDQVIKQERLRALGMMAGGIAHDFNNALTMMLGYGELLLPYLQHSAPEKERGYLRHMISAAEDARHVVSRLREFYRPPGADEVRVAVDLNAVVTQAVALTTPKWRDACRADGVQIVANTDLNDVPKIAGNAAELREVLTNLIFNAVDAMPKGGTITVATRAKDQIVRVGVIDTGIGMTNDERARCLEPFFTTKGDRGTGLGLSVAYGIVQRHGGSIDIVSEKGRGTTFTLSFPVTEVIASEAPANVEQPIDRSLRILIADDQEIICELIAEHLRVDGHEPCMASDGATALECFKSRPFDLVITDQSMPGMSGEQLAKAISETTTAVPVILLTGFGDEMQAKGRCPECVSLVVAKPVTAVDLRRAIQRVMMKEAVSVDAA